MAPPSLPSRLIISCIVLALCTASPARATWPHNPLVNVPVCTAAGDQNATGAVPDGLGGMIVVWADTRAGGADIYAQRVDADGVPLWTTNGVAVSTATGLQFSPIIASDGTGGSVIAWLDTRTDANGDVYAQKLNRNGQLQWAAGGVPVCTVTGMQTGLHVVADSSGGLIAVWEDARFGGDDVYAQRVSTQGLLRWTLGGVAVCSATGSQQLIVATSDGAGGVVSAWCDPRGGWDQIYAQRVNGNGVMQWTAQGVALATVAQDQTGPAIVPDGTGGAVVGWSDYRSGTNWDVYAQHVTSGGSLAWGATGVLLCNNSADQLYPTMATDGAGGAFLCWSDWRGVDQDLYAQHVDAGGGIGWGATGVQVCNSTGVTYVGSTIPDGAGGMITAWGDMRNGAHADVYAQHLSAAGVVLWPHDGIPVCTAPGNQGGPYLLPDGSGGALAVWNDFRAGATMDIYAQRFDRFGKLGRAEPAINRVADVPKDEGGKAQVEWTPSYLDTFPTYEIDEYSVWRRVPNPSPSLAASLGRAATGIARTADGRVFRTGVAGAQAVYWEYLSSTPARGLPGYSAVVPTTSDSMAGANPRTAFCVMAEATGGTPFWQSAADSGYSVDNLAPSTPAPFTGTYATGTSYLQWGQSPAADFAEFRLHRGQEPDFEPAPGNLVIAQASTGYVDAAGAPCFYKLAAVDIHANVSPYAFLQPGGTTDVPGTGLPRELALSAPAPNPLRGSCVLRLALPRDAQVTLAVYDQQGRRVRALLAGALPAGEHPIVWDGRDDGGRRVASGIYFVRCAAEGRTFTRRIAALR